MKSEMIKTLMYMEAVENGETITKDIESEKVNAHTLNEYDTLSLHTYQFSEYWLSRYKMKDISFMVKQFSWLSGASGSGV